MSKKKNTLKDLDEFLKQQAATLVSPPRLSDKLPAASDVPASKPESAEESSKTVHGSTHQGTADNGVTSGKVVEDLKKLSRKHGFEFKPRFYDMILQVMEFEEQLSPEDQMLINTILYLKHRDNWKEAVKEYWRKRRQ